MAAKASYGDLNKEERAHWDEYQTFREISDWLGFDAAQEERKQDARKWLVDRRKHIWRLAQPKNKGGDGNGWRHANRRDRHTFLKDENLNKGAPKHEVRLPAPAVCTNAEKVYIEEREGYLAFGSVTPEQKVRKTANLTWLVERRKRLYRLIKEEPTDSRRRRYDALCIATHTGEAYKEWDKKHNKWGVPLAPPTPKADSTSRAGIVRWCNKYVGVKEKPAGSNKGEPQPSTWERRVYGGTGVPWCACFAVCSAWDAGIKGSGTASVQLNVNLARRGQGIYRGYTTDPSRVRAGDHCAVGSTSTHTEVVVDPPYGCIGGNTGPSNIANGGMVAGPTNRRGKIVGWMLIREP
jgi:hypothetical protein